MDTNGEIQTQEERELLKNQFVQLREQGDFEASVEGLKNVMKWDQNTNNFSGELDVRGHLGISEIICRSYC